MSQEERMPQDEVGGAWEVASIKETSPLEESVADEQDGWDAGDIDVPIDSLVQDTGSELVLPDMPPLLDYSDEAVSSTLECLYYRKFDCLKKLLASKGVASMKNMKKIVVRMSVAFASIFPVPELDVAIGLNEGWFGEIVSVKRVQVLVSSAIELTSQGKFKEAVDTFRDAIYIGLLCPGLLQSNNSNPDEALLRKLLHQSGQYVKALTLELERKRAIEQNDLVRACELALYFTEAKINPNHLVLAYRTAIGVLYKTKNYVHCSRVINKLCNMATSPSIVEQNKKLLLSCNHFATDAMKLNYDAALFVDVCASSLQMISKKEPLHRCAVCDCSFSAKHRPQLCSICLVGRVGDGDGN